jgi:hypothetical protein
LLLVLTGSFLLVAHDKDIPAALVIIEFGASREEKEGRVEAVIDVLGVRKSKGTIIGGFLRRGISGGERKRVSIGEAARRCCTRLGTCGPSRRCRDVCAGDLRSGLIDVAAFTLAHSSVPPEAPRLHTCHVCRHI